ncbi:carboxymuconolactone decarboxylase family protein [Streptomyces sp. NPDC020412]|uniref:carboxymuconolactone decarboxylase family protein n=1 Tax=Streptomyces sp. NPDC020412 TaxID=3365073 RepID=UPI003789ED2C
MASRGAGGGGVAHGASDRGRHLQKAITAGGVDPKLLALVHRRASQINDCSACVYASVAGGKKAGDTDERLHNVAAWREAPFGSFGPRGPVVGCSRRSSPRFTAGAPPRRLRRRPPPRCRVTARAAAAARAATPTRSGGRCAGRLTGHAAAVSQPVRRPRSGYSTSVTNCARAVSKSSRCAARWPSVAVVSTRSW